MSMLSSMCEKLRETADEVERIKHSNADWLWRDAVTLVDTARELRDAANTIDYLRRTCNDLQVENEKLRNAMWDRAHARAIQHMEEDELRATCADLFDYVDELKALVRNMWDVALHPQLFGDGSHLLKRMDDLGVEVEE